MTTNEKIEKIRELMKKNNVDIYIIPSDDFHQSEDVAEYFKVREYVSGFTGSAGTLVITKEKSYLWTDGRYFIQAEKELSGSEIILCKSGTENTPTILEFLKNNMHEGETLGFDGRVVSYLQMQEYNSAVKDKNIKIVTNFDFAEDIWENRPSLPKEKIFVLSEKYSGESFENKIKRLRAEMKKEEEDIHIIASLDDIAWLFNIRGNDIPCTPVVLAYAYITQKEVILFIDKDKLTEETKEYFLQNKIEVKDYFEFYKKLKSINASSQRKILVDYARINAAVFNSIPRNKNIKIISKINPTQFFKVVKNDTEIENIIKAHIKDGTAVTKFMYWLKNNIEKEEITEISAGEKLEFFRREQKDFIEPSFNTISAYGSNAAMMHYSAGKNSNAVLEQKNLLLVDSGGQYLQGTTDITRTFALGKVDETIKKHYTTVLKSVIALSKIEFLHGTKCSEFDRIARTPVLELGLDYLCATGHGVGYLSVVHEGPNIFRKTSDFVLEENMITTVEPGIYIENSHGIRIENEILSRNIKKTEEGQLMNFETVTFAPIDLDPVNISLLTQEEKDWLNNYHKLVFEKISPNLNDEEREWLKIYTREI